MILGDKTCYEHILKINLTCVQSSDDVTLLGVMIDKNLTFKKHIDNLVCKAQYKLHALRRIRKFLTIEKAKILGNAFVDSQFNYASLICMFCRKTFYSKIEKILHRTLRVIYGIEDSYSNLLLRSNSVSIHQRHLRFLVTVIFKSISQINPEFMWSFFKQKKLSYSLRNGPILYLPRTQSTTVQMLFTLEVLLCGTIFLLKLNPAIQFSYLRNIDCG